MNHQDFELYHKVKHRLEDTIAKNDRSDAAGEARSQIREMESFLERQFQMLISHAIMNMEGVNDMLKSSVKSVTGEDTQ